MIPYFFVFLSVILLCNIKCKNRNYTRLLAIFLLIFFVGFRYDVGADYFSYQTIFEAIADNDHSVPVEIGYFWLNRIVSFFSTNFYFLTTIVALIQLGLLHLCLKDKSFYAFSVYIFMTTCLGTIVNEMRQYLAVAFFFYSLLYVNKSIIKYTIVILLGACFHFSILFLYPLYFILSSSLKPFLYPFIFIVILVLSGWGILDAFFVKLIGYTYYANIYGLKENVTAINSGLGFWIHNLMGLWILFYAKRIFAKYPQYIIYFNLFFVYLLFRNLFFHVDILMRMILYTQWSEIIIYPLFVSTFVNRYNRYMLTTFISIVFFILFVCGVMNHDYHLDYHMVNLRM